MSSWHAARTGKQPTTTTMQQQAIDKLQGTQANISSPAHMPPSFGSNHLVSPSAAAAAAAPPDDADWSGIPWSLTSLIQSLVSRESESSRNQLVLKSAVEELRRSQKELVSHAAVAQITVGTATLQREVAAHKAQVNSEKAAHEARMREMEATMAKQAETIAALTRRVAQLETMSATNVESLQSSISQTQRDIKERGLIMAKLGDRLMDEVDQNRVTMSLVSGQLKEVQRRVHVWEYSTAATAAGPTISNPANPFSASASLAQRKQPNFVTHDSIQSAPPGTAVFAAAAQEALAVTQSPESHPLASVIEQHKAEKEAAAAMQAQQEVHQGQPVVAADPQAQPAPVQGWESADAAAPAPLQLTAPTPAPIVATPVRAPPPAHDPSRGHLSAGPSSLVPDAPVGSRESTQFNRYMADYTTRNLQRDLLEIAETYQSTIRNEVDGMRGQLLAARRGHSEDLAKQNGAFDALSKSVSQACTEMNRTISAMEIFLKGKVTDLLTRMAQVEKTCGQIDGLSLARGAQLELKYQQRNEEIVTALTALQTRVDEHFGGRLPPQNRAGIERDLMVLHVNLEQSLRAQADRNTTAAQEVARLRDSLDEARASLQSQISGVHAQMKGLFADAFAAVHHDILPALTSSATGVHGAIGPTGEKARFLMRPRTMETETRTPRSARSGSVLVRPTPEAAGAARVKNVNVTSFENNAKYHTLPPTDRHPDSVQQISTTAVDEEKSGAVPASRGFGTSGQVRLRHTPVSSLSRGHGGTAATTPNGEIHLLPLAPSGIGPTASPRALSARAKILSLEREKPPQIEDALSVGRRELQTRSLTSHGDAYNITPTNVAIVHGAHSQESVHPSHADGGPSVAEQHW